MGGEQPKIEEQANVAGMPTAAGTPPELSAAMPWWKILSCVAGALVSFLVFLVGLGLMGDSFKVLGGDGAADLFSSIDNPLAGLMTGILGTVLVQSSSTSTSIVVSMVGEKQISVSQGIPIIFGANIGTSVTNTIVSMGSIGDRVMLERAFSGATVHDMFNMLTVLTLLPIELIIGAMQGEGGPLYWVSYGLTEAFMGSNHADLTFTSPIKEMTKVFTEPVLKANKYVIYALTLTPPDVKMATAVNEEKCEKLAIPARRISETDGLERSRSLLSARHGDPEGRRLEDLQDCSSYGCITKEMDKQFKKISNSSYHELYECSDYIPENDCASGQKCYLDAQAYYEKKVKNGQLVKGGFLQGAGDAAAGILGLVISIIFLCLGLIGLSTCLKMIFLGNAKKVLRYSTQLPGVLAIGIGVVITILVQSSSVTTSALTPVCAIGVLPLEKMLPLTLGANIGTTTTGLLATLVSLKFDSLQIALVHLLFNCFGILVWYPIPIMRRIPLDAARILGRYSSYYRFVPALYILVAFVVIPGIALVISLTFDASIAGGVVLLLFVLAGIAAFEFWWLVGYPIGSPGCYKVLSKEARDQGQRELDSADAIIRGEGDIPEVEEGQHVQDANKADEQGQGTDQQEGVAI